MPGATQRSENADPVQEPRGHVLRGFRDCELARIGIIYLEPSEEFKGPQAPGGWLPAGEHGPYGAPPSTTSQRENTTHALSDWAANVNPEEHGINEDKGASRPRFGSTPAR